MSDEYPGAVTAGALLRMAESRTADLEIENERLRGQVRDIAEAVVSHEAFDVTTPARIVANAVRECDEAREQVRKLQDKMERAKQVLDRYDGQPERYDLIREAVAALEEQ